MALLCNSPYTINTCTYCIYSQLSWQTIMVTQQQILNHVASLGKVHRWNFFFEHFHFPSLSSSLFIQWFICLILILVRQMKIFSSKFFQTTILHSYIY